MQQTHFGMNCISQRGWLAGSRYKTRVLQLRHSTKFTNSAAYFKSYFVYLCAYTQLQQPEKTKLKNNHKQTCFRTKPQMDVNPKTTMQNNNFKNPTKTKQNPTSPKKNNNPKTQTKTNKLLVVRSKYLDVKPKTTIQNFDGRVTSRTPSSSVV